MKLRLFLAVVAGTTAVVSTPVQAQTRLEFTPHLGMYFPLKPAVREASPPLTMRQVTSLVLGGGFALNSKKFSVEVKADYSPSQVATTDNSRTFDTNGGIMFASAKALMKFGPYKPKTPELQLGVGAGMISRFGKAWSGYSGGKTDPALVLAFGGRYPMGQWLPLNVKVEIENYISHVQFGPAGSVGTTKHLNHDTVWSVGFEMPLTGPDN